MSEDICDAVERVPAADLIPYTNNPKEHPDEQVQKIASSIKNYGFDQPIVVDEDNEIIKGHGRLQAAELLGMETVPVLRRDDLADAEKKAARIADNKSAESPWDDDLLSLEVEQVLDDFDPVELGFDDDELDDLLEDTARSEGEPANAEPLGLTPECEVIVECASETEQQEIFDELTEEGYECRLNSM
jgi:ParB-like chromosome segregation protein Spo0J